MYFKTIQNPNAISYSTHYKLLTIECKDNNEHDEPIHLEEIFVNKMWVLFLF